MNKDAQKTMRERLQMAARLSEIAATATHDWQQRDWAGAIFRTPPSLGGGEHDRRVDVYYLRPDNGKQHIAQVTTRPDGTVQGLGPHPWLEGLTAAIVGREEAVRRLLNVAEYGAADERVEARIGVVAVCEHVEQNLEQYRGDATLWSHHGAAGTAHAAVAGRGPKLAASGQVAAGAER